MRYFRIKEFVKERTHVNEIENFLNQEGKKRPSRKVRFCKEVRFFWGKKLRKALKTFKPSCFSLLNDETRNFLCKTLL